MALSLPAFIARWQRSTLSERSAAQSHFIDLCRLLGDPAPAEADPEGEFYIFEEGLRKSTGGDGFADVWKRGFFAWEYKGKHRSLVEAYRQLQLYQADLDYPPLLVTCDFDQFEVHTAFNNSARQSYRFRLADLADPAPLLGARYSALDTLRYLFTFFGVLHSRVHELWALRMGTQLESRPRYTPTTTFETFPFPWPPGREPVGDPRLEKIGTAARELVERRDQWLNPENATEAELAKRTLTGLYNQRPTWLELAHRRIA